MSSIHNSHSMWLMDEDSRRIAIQKYLARGIRETREINRLADLAEEEEARKKVAAECAQKKIEKRMADLKLARAKIEEEDERERIRLEIERVNAPFHPKGSKVKEIIKEICEHRRAGVRDVISGSRSHRITAVRHEICYWIRSKTKYSYQRIGDMIGGRDHTTVLHGVRKYAAKYDLIVPESKC